MFVCASIEQTVELRVRFIRARVAHVKTVNIDVAAPTHEVWVVFQLFWNHDWRRRRRCLPPQVIEDLSLALNVPPEESCALKLLDDYGRDGAPVFGLARSLVSQGVSCVRFCGPLPLFTRASHVLSPGVRDGAALALMPTSVLEAASCKPWLSQKAWCVVVLPSRRRRWPFIFSFCVPRWFAHAYSVMGRNLAALSSFSTTRPLIPVAGVCVCVVC